MNEKITRHIRLYSPAHVTIFLALSLFFIACLIFTLADQLYFSALLRNYPAAVFSVFTAVAILLGACIAASRALGGAPGIRQALCLLALCHSIFLWPLRDTPVPLAMPIVIIAATLGALFLLFKRRGPCAGIEPKHEKAILAAIILSHCIFFYIFSVRTLWHFSFFNSKDFAIYNQVFCNTIQGRFFENSTYGTNLSCHNTWFFLLLVPFYYLAPRPETLLGLKIAFLSLTAIPFYLIIRDELQYPARIIMVAVLGLYPYLAAQAFTPPHEIGYAPLFIMFTFYFFKRKAFWQFLILLLVTISIKEHLALLAVMLGLYSLASKRSLRWVVTPILIGIAWAALSYIVIAHFQAVYRAHPDASWFLNNLKNRLGQSPRALVANSNLSSWYRLKLASLLFAPLGFIPPFSSGVAILGLPEFVLNLLADRSCMFAPIWHYNITVSCFLLIAAAQGIRRISKLKFFRTISADPQLAIAIVVLSLTLIHSYSWLTLARVHTDTRYAVAVREVLRRIPGQAFVTVPENLAIAVSNRQKYSLLEDNVFGDFVITDEPVCPLRLGPEYGYTLAYTHGRISLYKKTQPGSD